MVKRNGPKSIMLMHSRWIGRGPVRPGEGQVVSRFVHSLLLLLITISRNDLCGLLLMLFRKIQVTGIRNTTPVSILYQARAASARKRGAPLLGGFPWEKAAQLAMRSDLGWLALTVIWALESSPDLHTLIFVEMVQVVARALRWHKPHYP